MNDVMSPANWDLNTLIKNWHAHLKTMISEGKCDLPFERLCFQSQTDPGYADILAKWPTMGGAQREEAWKKLHTFAEKEKDDMMPICVRCGVCCENGGPTLDIEDLELVQKEDIPWSALLTVRPGEPVHSNITGEAFFIDEEKIKIREKPGSKSCILYDSETKSCTIHERKPRQCRAQACWDPTISEQQATQSPLKREHLFQDVPPVMELVNEHDRRCSFEDFKNALEVVEKSDGKNIDEILNILAFDEHIRVFTSEQFKLPEGVMDLVFGQSLSQRVRLFGLHVEKGEDGSRTLMPLDSRPPKKK